MKKVVLFLVFFFWVIPPGFAQLKTYTFEEAELLSKQHPKPYFVFVHTSWCKYCKMMEKTTFQNPEVISILNDNFYFISFDAENQNPVRFREHTFYFHPTGTNTGYHELAYQLAMVNGQLSFPTITLLNPETEILYQHVNFLNVKSLKVILSQVMRN
ncbi:thioredoxin family protein [Flavobacterium cerinum]|uniref:Thioredoxin family protein n=1 Tax=Flavobacterium cerinum TaxID=2502784 RepID=A0ABY5IU20_9FLAO|nr:thioredoxin family protein [Flavobacterium cerinum]UUC46154.1 thioredoxin family protein [Flavobacterium cerinum]